jgi:hypothetical protein|tara:strand:+ start:509 stop:1162 length:654 start_codon:yes stop_codon:yes gene_type:complete
MKSFKSYLVENEQTFNFRIKMANVLSDDMMNALETALEKYEVSSITKPKKTPIQEHPMDFQTLNNAEVYIMDAELKYPVTADTLYRYISEIVGVPESHLVVINSDHPEEIAREEQIEIEKEPKESLLDNNEESDYPKQESLTGDEYNENMLKAIESRKIEYAAVFADKDKVDYSGPDFAKEGSSVSSANTTKPMPGKAGYTFHDDYNYDKEQKKKPA